MWDKWQAAQADDRYQRTGGEGLSSQHTNSNFMCRSYKSCWKNHAYLLILPLLIAPDEAICAGSHHHYFSLLYIF